MKYFSKIVVSGPNAMRRSIMLKSVAWLGDEFIPTWLERRRAALTQTPVTCGR